VYLRGRKTRGNGVFIFKKMKELLAYH